MADDSKQTLTDKWLHALKNNPLVAIVLVISIVVAGVASFSQSITTLYHLVFSSSDDPDTKLATGIEKLGSADADSRIDSITALEKLSTQESGKYQPKILEALSGYVRNQAPWNPNVARNHVEKDVQLALTTIARIPKRDDQGNYYKVDMHNVDISGANLESANFEGVILWGSNLRNVILSRANLRQADLGGVDFTGASLEMADLEGAYLWRSFLPPNRSTICQSTRMAGANLKNAHLEAAILTNAIDLTQIQINQAIVNENTTLPSGIVAPNQ